MVHFEHAWINRDDFSANIQDILLHSRGFKHVEISGVVVSTLIKQFNDLIFPISNFMINSFRSRKLWKSCDQFLKQVVHPSNLTEV